MESGNTLTIHGKDVFLKEEDIVLGTRFAEACALDSYVLFTEKTISKDKKRASIDLWLHNTNGNGLTQLTRSSESVSNPVLGINLPGADNQALFLKSGQVWTIPLDGGESAQVTSFPLSLDTFKVFTGPGDIIYLACSMSVYPDKSPEETTAIDKGREENEGSGMVFDQLLVRHWDTWNCYEKRNHLFIARLNVASSGLLELRVEAQREATDLMFGLHTDCPSKPFGGGEDYAISPDGKEVALSCRAFNDDGSQKRDMAWTTEVGIYTVRVPGTFADEEEEKAASKGLQRTSDPLAPGWSGSPSYSPDGTKLAYLRMRRAKYESDQTQVMVKDLNTHILACVSSRIDLSFGDLMWLSGESFFTTAQHRGSNRLLRVKIDYERMEIDKDSLMIMSGDESRVSPMLASSIDPFSKKRQRRLYFLESSLTKPNELRSVSLDKKDDGLVWQQEFNNDSCGVGFAPLRVNESISIHTYYTPCPQFSNGDITMPQVQQFYCPRVDEDGTADIKQDELVHSWYLPPVGLQSGDDEKQAPEGSVPLVLIIHGGPQGAFINNWNYRWNLSFYASRGYGVVCVNFHGSTGFGQKYCDSIRNDWGGQPYRDCMESVRYILEHKSYLNRDKVGAAGASYGGYMINWINGHAPEGKFKCLVNHDGIFSLRNLYYTTEELYFPEYEFGLPPMLAKSKECIVEKDQAVVEGQYDRWDPANCLDKWSSPTLVIQGGLDYRVVEVEGIATFTALQRRGIPSRMLFFPDENHWCLKAKNSLKWYSTVGAWLDQWLK